VQKLTRLDQRVEKMSYLVLALGAVLAFGGAFALFSSYGIILVERGWAGVIAGTTALASGIVTIALGLILHRLASVHALLKSAFTELPSAVGSADGGTAASGAAQLPHYIPKAAMPQEPAGGPAASGLRSWPQRQTPRSTHTGGRNFFKSRGTALPSPPRTREPGAASPPPFSPPDVASETGAAPEGSFEPGLDSGLPSAAGDVINASRNMLPQSSPADAAAAEDPRHGSPGEPRLVQRADEGAALAQPSVPETPIEHREPSEQPSPRHGAPAESAFIETILQGEGRAAFGPAPEASEDSSEKPLSEAPQETSPRPTGAPAAAQAAAHPAAAALGNELPADDAFGGAALAIVGRYESQGTSYIMYADGSIEARTDHAVIHFRSLDELKSFLDSQPQISKE
jgi:hypothetical protein